MNSSLSVTDAASAERHWPELLSVVLLAALVFVSVPWHLGHLGLSWDTLNHHIYLGWVADSPRFDKDYLAATGQSAQFPYLYWPLYRLAMAGVSGATAGAVLALLHVLAVPPVWWIARMLLPQPGFTGVVLRLAAVALGFMSAVPLKTFESTSNDFLAAIPVLWAVAMALQALGQAPANDTRAMRWSCAAGLLGGVGIAFKLSNGPLVALLPLVFGFAAVSFARRLALALAFGVASCVGFIVTYGYWGWNLWQMFGNPVYPFADGLLFAPLRAWTGWQP